MINSGLVTPLADTAFGDSSNVIQLNAGSGSASGLVNIFLPASRSLELTTAGGTGIFRAYTGLSHQIDGVISGPGNPVKTDYGIYILAAGNTYTGDTSVPIGTLLLAANAQLYFVIGAASGINNQISGEGTVILDGHFAIDTTAAVALTSGSWILENVTSLGGAYGASFSVVDPDGTVWTDAGNNTWSKTADTQKWTFTETTGSLILTASGTYTSWAFENGVSGMIDEDFDHDGMSNGIEYFMGQPGTGFTANPGFDVNHKISWPKGAAYTGDYGTDYAVQTSPDLTNWTDLPVAEVTNGNPLEYTLPPGSPVKFVRLKVTGP